MNAILSPDRCYRYALARDLQNMLGAGTMLFVGLNPSTADETQDDPTIRRVKGFAVREGFASLLVGNLFAFRSTAPSAMINAPDPIGSENDDHLQRMIAQSDAVLCGWGTLGKFMGRDKEVLLMIGNKAKCLAINADGTPNHPHDPSRLLNPSLIN